MFHPLQSAADLVRLGLSERAARQFDLMPGLPPSFDALVYCDGACSGNGKDSAPGGWGVMLQTAAARSAGIGHSVQTTNNRMELAAAIAALQQVQAGARVLLRTDSQYVIKGCTEWRTGWLRRGMTNSKGESVANPELWTALWAQVDARRVTFEWVRGHNGDPGNELADALAVLGVRPAPVRVRA